MKNIRILLADDHVLFRAGLRGLLKDMAQFEVIAEASDGREALELMEELRPDVVLMDISMKDANGIEATARAAGKVPKTKVIILSMNSNPELVVHALHSGAAGYVLKNVSPQELELAVRAVARGETYLCSAISRHVVEGCLAWGKNESSSRARLTSRQREVLQLIAEGNTTKIIAKKLGISVKTAESYRSELMAALKIHDVAGLTRYAIRTGVVSPDA
jgi:DNA-binding NarL/FixJ family response regulator